MTATFRLQAASLHQTTTTPFVRQTDKCILHPFHEYEYLSPQCHCILSDLCACSKPQPIRSQEQPTEQLTRLKLPFAVTNLWLDLLKHHLQMGDATGNFPQFQALILLWQKARHLHLDYLGEGWVRYFWHTICPVCLVKQVFFKLFLFFDSWVGIIVILWNQEDQKYEWIGHEI